MSKVGKDTMGGDIALDKSANDSVIF